MFQHAALYNIALHTGKFVWVALSILFVSDNCLQAAFKNTESMNMNR